MADELKEAVDEIKASGKCPRHVAIIMDGNGRWACKRGLPRTEGHSEGVKAVRRVVEAATEMGLKYLTLYTFSIENWKRPKEEVASLMELLSKTTLSELDDLMKNNIRLIATGRIEELPAVRRKVLKTAIKRTAGNTGLTLNLALNYGGRTEIIDAVKNLMSDVASGKVTKNNLDEKLFASYLYTADLPDPDFLIRTSGEKRLSNFLIWQTSYTEIHIIDTLWPDFGKMEFIEAIREYIKRERRFGKVSTQ